MNNKILIKKYSSDIKKELESINFSNSYIDCASNKLQIFKLKFFDLKPPEASILKQTCLSIGFDAAVGKDVITCKCEKSDALVCGTKDKFILLSEKLKKQPFRLKYLASDILSVINSEKYYSIGSKIFDFDKTYLMGILNITPDSFSDGGKNYNCEDAFINAMRMIEDGADIIDIGGESTRPSAVLISPDEEIKRVMPVIKKLKSEKPDILLSIDTIHPETAIAAINEGVNILNVVSNINSFLSIFTLLKNYSISVVITHSDCIPPVPVYNDFDGDIVDEIFKFFAEKIEYLSSHGLDKNLLILDPGIGFGKSINNQFELIKRADEFFTLKYPILYGISRKSFISDTFDIQHRDEISAIYAQYLISKKVNLLRVHDVKAHNNLKKYLSKII